MLGDDLSSVHAAGLTEGAPPAALGNGVLTASGSNL